MLGMSSEEVAADWEDGARARAQQQRSRVGGQPLGQPSVLKEMAPAAAASGVGGRAERMSDSCALEGPQ